MNTSAFIWTLSIGAFFWVSCSNTPSTSSNGTEGGVNVQTAQEKRPLGLRLMQSNCAVCHKLGPAENGSAIAPGMGEIRRAYLAAFPSEEAFVEALTAFSQSPSPEAVLLTEAYEKYGLMPKIGIPEEDLRALSAYLYAHDVGSGHVISEQPTGNAYISDQDTLSYYERGRKYALGTKQALGAQLMAAVQQKGAAGAVEFCHLAALPITDSMSTHYGVSIKRVSDKPRNLANTASLEERAYIEALKVAKAKGEQLPQHLIESGDQVKAYYAIETNEMCLKCHGGGEHISPDTRKVINDLYPNDLATGYGINQIRGLFIVEMPK